MKKLMKKAAAAVLAAIMLSALAPVSVFADDRSGSPPELYLEIKDTQEPARFVLTPQDIKGDFVFSNGKGETVAFSPSRLDNEWGRLGGFSYFVTEADLAKYAEIPEEYVILVKSLGKYALTQYPALPQGYSFVTPDETPYFEVEGDIYSNITLLVDSGSEIAAPPAVAPSEAARAYSLGILPDSLNSDYDKNITRAEFCRLAVPVYEKTKGAAIQPGNTAFSDTSDPDVLKMASLGVVSGVGGGRFNPDGEITREQAATILVLLLDLMGNPLTASGPAFDDNSLISGWAFAYVGKIQTIAIMSYAERGRFGPQEKYTREQSITAMLRIFDGDIPVVFRTNPITKD
ncbi:MAG: S-layer homology domain-containing protein [Clostridiales bacterium]|jgi:hypothetical protein|nr:S-layer homology domain-containing protein [Clostridiales bacterium]